MGEGEEAQEIVVVDVAGSQGFKNAKDSSEGGAAGAVDEAGGDDGN